MQPRFWRTTESQFDGCRHNSSRGMGPSVLAIDPSGHAVQIYHAMEQIGWDGKPKPVCNVYRSTTITGRRPSARTATAIAARLSRTPGIEPACGSCKLKS